MNPDDATIVAAPPTPSEPEKSTAASSTSAPASITIDPGASPDGVLRQLAQAPPFSAEQLPKLLAGFTLELATRYHVPQSDLMLAAIATAGTMASPRGRVETGWGKQSIPSNILVLLSPMHNFNLSAAIQHIVAPVFDQQREIIQRRAEADPDDLKQRLAAARQRLRGARDDRLGPFELTYNTAACERMYALHQLLRCRKPIIAIRELDRVSLMQALSQSFDGGLFCYNPLIDVLPNTSPGRNGRWFDYDLIWHCLNRVPILGCSDGKNTMFAEPSLGGVVIPIPGTEKRWLDRLTGPQGMKAGSLAIPSDARLFGVNDSIFLPLAFERDWSLQLGGLFLYRNIPSRPLTLSQEAKATLFHFQNEALNLGCKVSVPARFLIWAWPDMAARIAQGIHFTENTGGVIKGETMEAAVRLMRHYGARQLAAWLDAQEKGQGAKDDTEVELLLMRLKIKGPLTRRQLYRTYDNQRKALHEPAILRLLTQGKIVEDEQGRLLPAEIEKVTDALIH